MVRVIGDGSEQLGIMNVRDALRLARESDLDLVEVAPNANPPVCRILDYGKLKYLQEKKEREARKGQKSTDIREVRLRTRIGDEDVGTKVRKIRELLEDEARVKVSVVFRGREATHPELAIALLKRIVQELQEVSKLERPPLSEGRMLSIILAPGLAKSGKEDGPAAGPVQAEKKEEVTDAKAQNPQGR
jgi:translation initiation factor IF-3